MSKTTNLVVLQQLGPFLLECWCDKVSLHVKWDWIKVDSFDEFKTLQLPKNYMVGLDYFKSFQQFKAGHMNTLIQWASKSVQSSNNQVDKEAWKRRKNLLFFSNPCKLCEKVFFHFGVFTEAFKVPWYTSLFSPFLQRWFAWVYNSNEARLKAVPIYPYLRWKNIWCNSEDLK